MVLPSNCNKWQINISLTNSAIVDIDFAIWGPFTSPTGGCLPSGSPIDCSFSTAATEQVDIPSAVAGQFYLLLITNFSGQPTNITATAKMVALGQQIVVL
jgi:hypothetical protein